MSDQEVKKNNYFIIIKVLNLDFKINNIFIFQKIKKIIIYRSEYLGACGANSNRSSYQMYVCKDEFYRPAQPDLAYRLTDIKCLNSTCQAVDKDQKPLPTEQIKDYYPDIKKSETTLANGKACYTEREQLYNEENNSAQCAIGYTKFSIFDCR